LYWPLRVERGGEVVVPGKPTDPIQIIDVRDLAEWIVRLIETGTMGTFNATGPATPLSCKAMLEGCRRATGTAATFAWIDPAFIRSHGVNPEAFQLWVDPDDDE